MKRIIALIFIISSIDSFGQQGWIKPNNSVGTISNGISPDSSFKMPTGCGAPVLYSKYLAKADQYFDSCNHKFYVYDPKLAAWDTLQIGVGGSGSSIAVSHSIFVDDVYGSDVTGTVDNESKPYKTLAAAKTDATSGYTIVVRPGTYTYDGTTLLKNGVNWYFEPGAIVNADATQNQSMFGDGGSAISCTVTGYGKFYDTAGGRAVILETTNSGSRIYFECQSMVAGNGDVNQTLTIDAGIVTVFVRTTIECLNYDAIVQTGGELNLTADKLLGSASGGTEGSGFEMVGGTANIMCREIRTQGAYDAFGSSAAVVFGGGIAIIHADIIADLADGLVLYTSTAGTLTVRGRITSTSRTAVMFLTGTTSKNILLESTLISNTSYDSIDAPGAQTVVSYGAFANKAVDANITINGILTVGSYVK